MQIILIFIALVILVSAVILWDNRRKRLPCPVCGKYQRMSKTLAALDYQWTAEGFACTSKIVCNDCELRAERMNLVELWKRFYSKPENEKWLYQFEAREKELRLQWLYKYKEKMPPLRLERNRVYASIN